MVKWESQQYSSAIDSNLEQEMTTKIYLAAAIGGGFGSVLRLLVVDRVRHYSQVFPNGVMVVNLFGSLLIGVVAGYLVVRTDTPEWLRIFFMIGILGGFTTFSSFSYDTLGLLRAGEAIWALVNIIVQVCGGILLAAVGYYLAHAVFR